MNILRLTSDFRFSFLTGGALKPSNTANLWVHVTCAWFVPEVRFRNIVKMQPAEGLVNIQPTTFQQVNSYLYVNAFECSTTDTLGA